MKFYNFLNEEKFNVGDWVIQKKSDYNIYGLLVAQLKNGGFKAIVGNDSDTKYIVPATKSTKNWYPQPIKVSEKDVPDKLFKKILDKKKEMGY